MVRWYIESMNIDMTPQDTTIPLQVGNADRHGNISISYKNLWKKYKLWEAKTILTSITIQREFLLKFCQSLFVIIPAWRMLSGLKLIQSNTQWHLSLSMVNADVDCIIFVHKTKLFVYPYLQNGQCLQYVKLLMLMLYADNPVNNEVPQFNI